MLYMSRYSTYSDKRKKQINEGVKRRRKKIKTDLINHMGGKCSVCGYNKCHAALEFHHLDPTQKEFSPSTNSKSWDKILVEAEKCILVCANCHREIHNGL